MLLNMDAELQHLISISMEKMTSSTGSSPTGRGSRKARGMDLRKALLVAHFLQEVRCAYFEDDHKIVANTLNSFKNECENETTIKEKQEKSKDIDNRCKEESRTYFMNTDSENFILSPSSSMFQSCVTNTDLMVSRISQVTQPLAISVNTNYVMSHQSDLAHCALKEENGEEVPAFSEELEISSSEETIVINDSSPTFSEDMTLHEQINSDMQLCGSDCQSEAEVTKSLSLTEQQTTKQQTAEINKVTLRSNTESKITLCPLPKKKRPLPKEFWDSDNKSIPALKLPKIHTNTSTESTKITSSQFVTNNFTTSVAHTVTLESKTSTSLSTVCSVMGSAEPQTGKFQTNPKVVVQITQSCDSYLPISCSTITLERRLSEIPAMAF